MYLLRIEVKCFSRILCLPKLLEFPHISSLLSFLILSALSHEESDFYHLSTDERTALCWHRSQHSDGPWTLHSPYCLSFPTLLYSPCDAPPHIVYPYSFSFLAFFISFFLFLFFIYIALLYLITGALTHSSYHARTRSYETNLPIFFSIFYFRHGNCFFSLRQLKIFHRLNRTVRNWTWSSIPRFIWICFHILIADITKRIPDICFVLHMNRNICCNLKVSLPLLINFFRQLGEKCFK